MAPRSSVMKLVPAVVLSLVLLGCGVDDGQASPPTTDATPSTAEPPTPPLEVDWRGGTRTVEVGSGWTVGPCESGPRQLCIRKEGTTRGTLELLDWPVATFDPLPDILGGGGSTGEALRAHADSLVAVFEEDRAVTCGGSYEVTARTPQPATVGGHEGLTYGFDGTRSGELVERVVQWATVQGSSVWIAGISAMEVGACGDDAHIDDLTPTELAQVQEALAEIVANSELPEPSFCAAPGGPAPVPCEVVPSPGP